MLSAAQRLHQSKDIKKLWQSGPGVATVFFVVKTLPNTLGRRRANVLISNKVSPKAVVRNRYKRWTRESLRLQLKELKKDSCDVVCLLKPTVTRLKSLGEVSMALAEALKKAKLL